MAKINLGRIKLQFQGEYDKSQVYRRDDIVYHNNCMWILTSEYMPDGTNAFAPGTKILGYNPKENNGWTNDPNFTNTDAFNYTQYWTENERKAKDKLQIWTVTLLLKVRQTFLTKTSL